MARKLTDKQRRFLFSVVFPKADDGRGTTFGVTQGQAAGLFFATTAIGLVLGRRKLKAFRARGFKQGAGTKPNPSPVTKLDRDPAVPRKSQKTTKDFENKIETNKRGKKETVIIQDVDGVKRRTTVEKLPDSKPKQKKQPSVEIEPKTTKSTKDKPILRKSQKNTSEGKKQTQRQKSQEFKRILAEAEEKESIGEIIDFFDDELTKAGKDTL